MKSTEKNKPSEEKKPNPETGTGKQDREPSRESQPNKENNYGDDFAIIPEKNKTTQESVTFEQDIENERQNDPERDPQKREPLGENEGDLQKKGKVFESGIDEGNDKAI